MTNWSQIKKTKNKSQKKKKKSTKLANHLKSLQSVKIYVIKVNI